MEAAPCASPRRSRVTEGLAGGVTAAGGTADQDGTSRSSSASSLGRAKRVSVFMLGRPSLACVALRFWLFWSAAILRRFDCFPSTEVRREDEANQRKRRRIAALQKSQTPPRCGESGGSHAPPRLSRR